jgi:hypothetical protein
MGAARGPSRRRPRLSIIYNSGSAVFNRRCSLTGMIDLSDISQQGSSKDNRGEVVLVDDDEEVAAGATGSPPPPYLQ